MLSLATVACAGPLQPDEQPLNGTVVLSRSAGQASAPIVGTFRSVVDSLALSVTIGGTSQTLGHKFAAGEAAFTSAIRLPAGTATAAAEIFSNNGTRLFFGSWSTVIDRDGFSIDVSLSPSTPVLTVFTDTVRLDSTVTFPRLGAFRFASVTVHNSGKDSLAWSVAQTASTVSGICQQACPIQPLSGTLAANGDAKVLVAMPVTFPSGAPVPAGSFTYVFTSKEGAVTLQWRYLAGP